MHLTPEQIDRQPFRMRRRGYDMVQVRNFLREIADEMRARQEVRDRLASTGDGDAVADQEARRILDDARARADDMLTQARAAVVDGDLEGAREQARLIVQAAEHEAAQILDQAEVSAKERSSAVISDTQERLDGLLAEERAVRARLAEASPTDVEEPPGQGDAVVTEVSTAPAAVGSSFADFMKSAVREEIAAD